jgi:hypothetical protein
MEDLDYQGNLPIYVHKSIVDRIVAVKRRSETLTTCAERLLEQALKDEEKGQSSDQ